MNRKERRAQAKREFDKLKPEEKLGDGPVEIDAHAQMTAIAKTVDEFLNGAVKAKDPEWGFVLMTFRFGDRDGARCNYMSNGTRQDVITLMKEMVARFEGQPHVTGRA